MPMSDALIAPAVAVTMYAASVLRGYKGEFYYINTERCTTKDYLYLFICLTVFIILRYFPI